MLRDNLAGLIEPMRAARELNPLALFTEQKKSSVDRPQDALKIPAPKGRNLTLTENAASPFHAEPRHLSAPLSERTSSAYKNTMEFWEKSAGDLLGRLLYTDIKTYLVELLMKQDNMSMAASVESRVPFLDHQLVEFAAAIPRAYMTSGVSGKLILKSAVKDLLPESIIYRKKLGFPTPWSTWMAGSQLNTVEDLLLEPRTLRRGMFRPEKVRELVAQHRARSHDHADRLWRLLNLELWHRVFIDGESMERDIQGIRPVCTDPSAG